MNPNEENGRFLAGDGGAGPGAERLTERQLTEARAMLGECRELIEAAEQAIERLSRTRKGVAAEEALRTYIGTGEPGIDVGGIVLELLQGPEVSPVLDIISKLEFVGIRGVGLGLTAEVSFVWPGWGAGVDGVLMLPYAIGNDQIQTQFVTRSWSYAGRGVEFLASTGLTLSIWTMEPVDSRHMVGADVSPPPIFPVSRVAVSGWIPVSQGEGEVESELSKVFKFIFIIGVSRYLAGFDIGVGMFRHGRQEVGVKWDVGTLSIENTKTGTPYVILDEPCTLLFTITPPMKGTAPTRIFQSKQTTMQLRMPKWLLEAIVSGALTVSPPLADWTTEPSKGETLNLTYTGPDNLAWMEKLVFYVVGVKNDPGVKAQYGQVTWIIDGMKSTSKTRVSKSSGVTPLQLMNLSFRASLSWEVGAGEGFIVEGPRSGVCTANSPPEKYRDIVGAGNETVTVTDPDGVVWRIGYVFAQNEGENSAYIQAAWFQQGAAYFGPRTTWTSEQYTLGQKPVTVRIDYAKKAGSANYLQFVATPEAVNDAVPAPGAE